MKTSVDQELMDAIEKEISGTGYMLSVTITRESQELESAAIKQFLQNGMSGLIIFPTEKELYNEDILTGYKQKGRPSLNQTPGTPS